MAVWHIQQDETGEYGYELKDNKLYYIERDKGSNASSSEEVGIQDFIKHYKDESQEPYPQIIQALQGL
jgi:hypothetical protein